MRRFFQLGTICISLLIGAASSGQAEDSKKKEGAKTDPNKITWLSYDDALKQAREENKHMFVDFTATWCGWCKKLERDTFSKSEVIEMLNKNFVSTKVWDHKTDMLDIDGYKIAEKDLGKTQFGVRSFPTLWFVSPEGEKIGPMQGYVNAETFLKALNWVNDYEYIVASADEESTKEEADK